MVEYVVCLEYQSTGVRPIAEAAVERDLRLAIITSDPSNPRLQKQIGSLSPDYQKSVSVHACEYNEIGSVNAVIASLDAADRVRGIFSPEDDSVETASQVAMGLGLPTSPPASIKACRNKQILRTACADFGLSSIKFCSSDNRAALLDGARRVGFPAVAKPSNGQGKEGIQFIWSEDQLISQADSLLAEYRKLGGTVLLERFIPGPTFSAECMTINGVTSVVGVMDRRLSDLPLFNEINLTYPSVLPLETLSKIDAFASDVHRACRFTHGPSHLEFVLGPSGIELLELNPRIGGAGVGHAVSLAHGFNFFDLYISSALGIQPEPISAASSYLSQTILFTPRVGRISRILNTDLIGGMPGFTHLEFIRGPGDTVSTIRDANGWLGFLLMQGETHALATRYADAAQNLLYVEMEL